MENQIKQMDYWEEKAFEIAKELFCKAIEFNDRAATFDPVNYAIVESRRFIDKFKKVYGLD